MPPRKPSPVGVQVPVGGGLATSGLPYAREVGARAVQVFVGNPRGWATPAGDARVDEAFRSAAAAARMPVFVHASWPVNLGSATPETGRRSVASVRHALGRGHLLGARGVVVHTGSAGPGGGREAGLRQVRERLLPVLDEIPDDGPDLLLEPTAEPVGSLCSLVEDLGPYLDALERHPRLGVCLDTCHAFAAGHDLAAPGGLRRVLDLLVRTVGRGRLKLVHANDSKDPCGARRDRHESIGRGSIGTAPFAELFCHSATRGVPVVVETPGGIAEHRRDVQLLEALRDR